MVRQPPRTHQKSNGGVPVKGITVVADQYNAGRGLDRMVELVTDLIDYTFPADRRA